MFTKIYLGYPQEYIKNKIIEEVSKKTIVKYLDGSTKSFLIEGEISGDISGSPTTQIDNVQNATEIKLSKNVTTIGNDAFLDCQSLSSIEIPETVESIGVYAFGICDSLSSIELPNSITGISYCAFYDCDSLSSIEIPNSVSSIDYLAFPNCTSLSLVYFDKPISEITSMTGKYWGLRIGTRISASNGIITVTGSNTGTFEEKATPTIITYTDGTTSSIINEDGILTWEEAKGGNSSYDRNTTIKSVTIGTDTSSIGHGAFNNCISLSSIEIPNSVTSIGDEAFYYCTSLSSIAIPSSVPSIGDYAFNNCHSLSSVIIPNSVTSIGSYAFYNCRSLSSIEIPSSVTNIGYSAFGGCSSLTSITYDKPMSEISSMNDKYWELQTGCKIYASDGIITVTTGVSSGGSGN